MSIPVLSVTACGRTWQMERPADLESLWDAMDVLDKDERIPYWTEIWPSSLALGDWLHERRHDIAGRPALDMGCGIGLTALIGQSLGAAVIGMDYEPEALLYARQNAVRNAIRGVCWTVMDWRTPAVRSRSLPAIWAGDIMYERRFATPILDFMAFALTGNGIAWIAEPCRSVYTVFRETASQKGLACDCVWETSVKAPVPQAVPVPVRIWQLQRKDTPS